MNVYFCSICKHNHKYNSRIGQKHLSVFGITPQRLNKMAENERNDETEFRTMSKMTTGSKMSDVFNDMANDEQRHDLRLSSLEKAYKIQNK